MPGGFDGDRDAPLIPDLLDSQSVVDGGSGGSREAHELPVLTGQANWARWLQEIQGLARICCIWDYVDPRENKELVMPERPLAPRTPTFMPWTKREPYEAEADHEARLAEHKLRLDLVARNFAIKQEQYRVDCIEYAFKLDHYTKAEEEMNQLNRKIYTSVDDKFRPNLMGGMTTTPRLKLKKLEHLILGNTEPPRSVQESPRSQFAKLLNKLESRGPRDWSAWATEVASLGKCCEELGKSRLHDQMAKDGFLQSIQDHHPGFYRRWSDILDHVAQNGERSASFQDLVNAFIGAQDNTTATSEGDSVCSEKKVDNRKRHPADDSNGNDSPTPSTRSIPSGTVSHKRCPGCRLSHRIKGDSWWQSCWYFDAYMGRDTAPSFFKIKAESVEYVRIRLEAYPEEHRLATLWDARM